MPLSFTSAKLMFSTIDTEMEGGPDWKSEVITLPDAPEEPQTLYYRDPDECAAYLFGNPAFSDVMDYGPCEVYEQEDDVRVYHEMSTGELWAQQQVCFSPCQS